MKIFFKIFLFIITIYFSFINIASAKNELLMVTDKNCIFCIVWEKEIGKIYPKTEIAKTYPLKRIEIKEFNKKTPMGLKKANVTPTFILIKNKKEKGIILGYSNPEMFWWRIDEILELN